jgi:hypothetical protein
MIDILSKQRNQWLNVLKSCWYPEWDKDKKLHKVEFEAWYSMLSRCYNPDDPEWANEGVKGITVTKKWRGPNGFENFFDFMGPHPDRIGLRIEWEEWKKSGKCSGFCKSCR